MACECTYNYDARFDSVDAWELEKYYSCYESPTPVTDCRMLHVGDSVEWNNGNERMWGIIIEICEDCSMCCDFVAEITSDLLLDHPYAKGDFLLLTMSNIYNHVVAPDNIPEPCDARCCSPYVVPEY